MSDGKRVVLIKPGDALILGNMGEIGHVELAKLGVQLRDAGFPTVLIAESDVTVDSLTLEEARAVVEYLERREVPCNP